jgi:hypothetical protein
MKGLWERNDLALRRDAMNGFHNRFDAIDALAPFWRKET